MSACVAVAQDLIRLPSTNPPGEEAACISYLAKLVEGSGFAVETYEFAPDRPSLVARLSGRSNDAPLCFTGHVDVVPLGAKPWSQAPFGGDIVDGKLYGRGSADMKAGVAAFVEAAREAAATTLNRGLTLVITAGEETGCEGAFDLARRGVLGKAALLIVAEPSSNELILAHKGSLRLAVTARGKTAHSSMPELGDNAIYRAVNWIGELEGLSLPEARHPLLGAPTMVVTTIHGGLNINSVPDAVTFTIDFRSLPSNRHDDLLDRVRQVVGSTAEIIAVADLPGFSTAANHAAVAPVIASYERLFARTPVPRGAPYFTDASALTPGFGDVPTVVIGPGDMDQAHQTDEHCVVSRLEESFEIYRDLIGRMCL
jgi:succinyl-diaminopimelate desuccinylase